MRSARLASPDRQRRTLHRPRETLRPRGDDPPVGSQRRTR